MKQRVNGFLILLLLSIVNSHACTTFLINSRGQLVFGRNYDWVTASGAVHTNPRGILKHSLAAGDDRNFQWIARYGSVTFNQYGKEFPTGGMNEKGLVVELMWADGSRYPDPDKRPALGVLQWIQYQLDNHSTVAQVVASDSIIRISPDNPPLHYLVADAEGNAAAIEYYNGKLVAHSGADLPFPVLTNSSYELSKQSAIEADIKEGNKSFSFQDNSLQRFAQACSMVEQYGQGKVEKPVVDYAFDILQRVSQQGFTKWSIVYDIANLKIYFQTDAFRSRKYLSFSELSFECAAGSKMLNMNQPMAGVVVSRFIPFNDAMNRSILKRSVTESRPQVNISEEAMNAHLAFPGALRCDR